MSGVWVSRTGPVLSHSHLRVKCGEAVKKYLNKNKNKRSGGLVEVRRTGTLSQALGLQNHDDVSILFLTIGR